MNNHTLARAAQPSQVPVGGSTPAPQTRVRLLHSAAARFVPRSALIQQICCVKRKDIRKFLDGIYVSYKGNIIED